MTASSDLQACDLLIEAGWVVPAEPHGVGLEDHAVTVRDGAIVAVLPIAEARARFTAAATVSRPAGLLLPRLGNAHYPTPRTLVREVSDDLPMNPFVPDPTWPRCAALTARDFVHHGTHH